ncbi:hypothetical protein QFZ91_007448 [Paraburkholderia sp. JPY419]
MPATLNLHPPLLEMFSGSLKRFTKSEGTYLPVRNKSTTTLSFIRAVHTIQYEMAWAAVTPSYGKLPALLKRLRERLNQLPNERRPGRTCARAFRYTVRFLRRNLN